MSQSTLGDSAAGRGAQPQVDYERAFKVLQRCDQASSLMDFKVQLVEALGSVMGYGDVSFFAGPTFHTTFADRHPVVAGRTAKMLDEYSERWWAHDVFGSPRSVHALHTGGVAALSELAAYGALPPGAQVYVEHFLNRTWHVEAAAALRLDLYGMHTGLVGIFCADRHQLGPSELATLRVLSRQVSAVARGIPFVSSRDDLRHLTLRQREVALLVAEGFTNAQIAQALSLAEDSVKKYVTRVLAATGCSSRMELALVARSLRGTRSRV